MAWAAGLFEGEGCIYSSGPPKRSQRSLIIAMTDRDVVERFHRIVGVGRMIERPKTGVSWQAHWKTQFEWRVGNWPDILMLATEFRPWLGARRIAKLDELLAHPPRHPNALRQLICKRGHPLDGPESDVRTTVSPKGKVQRQCRVCVRELRTA